MPFSTLQPSGAPESAPEYTPNLPEPLVVAVLDREMEREGRTSAVLVYGFVYDHPASGARIHVPENYVTDFASIPDAARLVFSPFGRHAKAAVLHDFLYAVGEPDRRWFADQVFRDAMAELRVEAAAREIMFQAVSLFGAGPYGRAEDEWANSWGDWRTGQRTGPAIDRSAYYHRNWPARPAESYQRESSPI